MTPFPPRRLLILEQWLGLGAERPVGFKPEGKWGLPGGVPQESPGLSPETCPRPWMPPNSRSSPSKGKRVPVASHSPGFHTYSLSRSRAFWADWRPRPYAGKPRGCWQAGSLPPAVSLAAAWAWGCSWVSGGSLVTGAWTAWSCAGRWPSSSEVRGALFYGRLLPSSTGFQSKQNGIRR